MFFLSFLSLWFRDKTYHAVELGSLVALGPTHVVLGFAGAELAKVFGRLGDDIFEKLKRDTTQ